ncbi:hypothetical protein AWU65_07670 [Paenibacillus glucanolyticus]|uniref:Glycosyltransferase 2-like domain-containing protein n=1 Tax=Paenibacillus glucanolyticus TaxID=59843 RepID=A0A163I4Y1_9BACL|nr:glycosyltransferase family 2 protein [Paenibacillus glucanolyticus]KZS45796.1 hypothetical protein AWU65_07670 [Paenibacillus glucanolyticus]
MKLPISICIVAKNEEQNIKECIVSAKEYVEEVIVLDTGSTDRTRLIAEKEGGNIKEFKWDNDFSNARNRVVHYASQPYILMMDADERLTDVDLMRLQKDLKYLNQNTDMVGRVEIHHIMDEGIMKSNIVRLFPNHTDFKYMGKVHEQLFYRDNRPNTFNTCLVISHLGYDQYHIENKNKVNRNLVLLHMQLEEDPEDSYILFQLGRTYSVNNQSDLALYYLEKALIHCDLCFGYHPSIIQSLAKVYLKEKRWESLVNLLDSSLTTYPLYTDLYYIYGCALIEMKNVNSFHLIPEAFEKCIEIGEADISIYESESGVGTYLAHYNLGLFYELTLKLDKARYHYEVSSDYGFELSNNRLALLP